MFFALKTLASALLLSTTVFGVAVEHLEKRAQPKGIDVSSYQSDVNWKTVKSKGISFAYIKATQGTSKGGGMLVVQDADSSFQPTKTRTSPPSTLAPPTLVSFEVPTTSPFLTSPLVPLRQSFSPPTVEAGRATASPSRVPSTSNVRVAFLPPLRFTN
jgi:hypothetical protein